MGNQTTRQLSLVVLCARCRSTSRNSCKRAEGNWQWSGMTRRASIGQWRT